MHAGRGDDRKFDTKSSGGAAVNLILQVMLFMCCLPEYSSREEIAKGGRSKYMKCANWNCHPGQMGRVWVRRSWTTIASIFTIFWHPQNSHSSSSNGAIILFDPHAPWNLILSVLAEFNGGLSHAPVIWNSSKGLMILSWGDWLGGRSGVKGTWWCHTCVAAKSVAWFN